MTGSVSRSISILALLGMLAVPAVAGATSGPSSGEGGAGSGDGDTGTAGGTGGGDVGSGEGTASVPASTGEPATSTTGDHDTDHHDTDDDDDGKKGCSIGGRDTAPGVLALALLGLHGLRRRRG